METADYYREKATHCRTLAEGIIDQKDPAVANLRELAAEFEARAVAFSSERPAEKGENKQPVD